MVHTAYQESLRAWPSTLPAPDAISRSNLFKDAMHQVTKTLLTTRRGRIYWQGEEDTLSSAVALRLIAAVERQLYCTVAALSESIPYLWHRRLHVGQAGLTVAQLLVNLKHLAVELTEEEVLRDLRLDQDLRSSQDESAEHFPATVSRRSSITTRIARLTRRSQSTTIGAMLTDDHQVETTPEAMARLLCAHWEAVFGNKDVDEETLARWLYQAQRVSPAPLDHPEERWRLRRKDLTVALRIAGNSRPGPDGITYSAWRRLGPLGLSILYDVACQLEVGLDPANDEHRRFNAAFLCCLPKTASHQDELGRDCYRAAETRPLAIANTDNRLIASAYRLRWEPLIEPRIDSSQRGFLRGRSMMRNIIDLEHHAMLAAAAEEDSAIVLFDFVAAFPSISRLFLRSALVASGVPPLAMRVIDSLYLSTTGQLLLQGTLFGTIEMARGIRQGCPLSPLLFALATDSLLRILRERHPDSFVAAFADDTAMVVRSWSKDARAIHRTFVLYERVSLLQLHLNKTIAIPLWHESPTEITSRFRNTSYPQFIWAMWGRGIMVGPGKSTHSWDKPAAKFLQRLTEWPWNEVGVHHAIRIYNIYIITTLLFVAQVEALPEHLRDLEAQAFRRLAPGAGDWIAPWDLQRGHDLGLSAELRPLRDTCFATMARLRAREAETEPHYWVDRAVALRRALAASPHWDRLHVWEKWFKLHIPTVVENQWPTFSTRRSGTSYGFQRPPSTLGRSRAPGKAFRRGYFAAFVVNTGTMSRTAYVNDKTDSKCPECPATWLVERSGTSNVCGARLPRECRLQFSAPFWNRWTTDTRMRSVRPGAPNRCLLGCNCPQSDKIEHYLRCPAIQQWMDTRLAMDLPDQTSLEEWMLTRPLSRLRLQQLSVTMYCAYRLINHLRHTGGRSTPEYRIRFLKQMLHEAVRGDAKLRAALHRARAARFCTPPARRLEAPPLRRTRRRVAGS